MSQFERPRLSRCLGFVLLSRDLCLLVLADLSLLVGVVLFEKDCNPFIPGSVASTVVSFARLVPDSIGDGLD